LHPRLPTIPQHLAHGGGTMNIAYRSTAVLALTCCLFPAVVNAQQLQQPASVLPLKSLKPLPTRGIVAPQADEVPTWLLKASPLMARKSTNTTRVARKSARPEALPRVETENFSMLGEIRLSYPRHDGVAATKRTRSSRTSSDPSIEVPNAAHARNQIDRIFSQRR